MTKEIIKSKQVKDGILDLFEFKNDSGEVVNYSLVKACRGRGVTGGGAAKIEEENFSDKQKAIDCFNKK